MALTLGVGPTDATDNSGATTVAVTLAGTTAGRSLVVAIRWLNSTALLSSVSCSGESDLTLHTRAYEAGTARSVQMATLDNITTGGSKTITATFDAGTFHSGIVAVEVVGADTSGAVDANANANGSSTNPTVNITTTVGGAAIVGIVSTNAAAEPDPGAGYTRIVLGQTTGFVEGEYVLDAGAAGVKAFDFTAGSGAWAIAAVALKAMSGAIFNLPISTLAAVGGPLGGWFNLPMLTLAAGNPRANFDLPITTLSAAGFLTAAVVPDTAEFTLPMLTLSAIGVSGSDGSGVIRLPLISLVAAGIDSGLGSGAPVLPVLRLSAAGLNNGLGSSTLSLPILLLSATGATGGYGIAAINLPVLTVSSAAVQSVIGTAAFSLPVLYLSAQGAAALTAAYKTWVLNTKKNALTEYDSFSFNSFALFQGAVLAAGPSGVFTLGTQALDDTTAIDALVRTARADYDVSLLKRVPRIYLGHETDGDLLFRTITSENGTRTYQLIWNHVTGEQQRRIPVGKGPKSRYWQYEIENVNGSDFSLQDILVYPTLLRRRVM